MEEILASIRKIIADDQILPLTRAAAPPQEAIASASENLVAEAPQAAPAVATEVAKPASSIHSMSEFEAAFAELRPSFSRPVEPPAAPAVEPGSTPATPIEAPIAQIPKVAAPLPVSPSTAFPKAEIAAKAEAVAIKDEGSLVSPATGASVSSAFNALATTMFLQNTSMVEEAIRDLLRPMLKNWLDDNLPTLVERLVRAEIERVARGGR